MRSTSARWCRIGPGCDCCEAEVPLETGFCMFPCSNIQTMSVRKLGILLRCKYVPYRSHFEWTVAGTWCLTRSSRWRTRTCLLSSLFGRDWRYNLRQWSKNTYIYSKAVTSQLVSLSNSVPIRSRNLYLRSSHSDLASLLIINTSRLWTRMTAEIETANDGLTYLPFERIRLSWMYGSSTDAHLSNALLFASHA